MKQYLKDLIEYQKKEIESLKSTVLAERSILRPRIVADESMPEGNAYILNGSLLDEVGKVLDFNGERWRVYAVNRNNRQITLEKA